MIRSFLIGLCIAVFASSPALAATIQAIKGETLINRGGAGFQKVVGSATWGEVGDLVMVRPDGRAAIVYEDGCSVPVLPGDVAKVQAQSPCNSGRFSFRNHRRAYLLGGLAIGGIAAGIIALTNNNGGGNGGAKEKPASP
jgi:hypothetical protein